MSSASSSSQSKEKISQPEWHGPFGSSILKVRNSLTSSIVPFIPRLGVDSKNITWYICGPTVYDTAHLGHARAYVTFDILRRLLTDYFGYNVFFVMNITDLDDKIILKARRNHIHKQYIENLIKKQVKYNDFLNEVSDAFKRAMNEGNRKLKELEGLIHTDIIHSKEHEVSLKQEQLKLDQITQAQIQFDQLKTDESNLKSLIDISRSVLSEKLDAENASKFTDHSIFKAHASYYEAEFLEDMKALGIRLPDALTRVTEYVDKIIKLVQSIIDNGYAYHSNNSVYFDTVAFVKAGKPYAKLAPWSAGNLQMLLEGEGALTSGDNEEREKRSPSDFALWKRSKSGEPEWNSPWGQGRPGWHIECSAMAIDLLGDNIDIHSGGEDLKFPHHDNELAQSEAATGSKQWVNHFWHAGHLNIKGLKMSKSLKNFVTIRQVLSTHTARQIRLLFLSQPWDGPMNFSDDALDTARDREKTFNEFFGNIAAAIRSKPNMASTEQIWDERDKQMHNYLVKTQQEVHASLCNNFNFPDAVLALEKLVTEANKYRTIGTSKSIILSQVAGYVDKILRCTGVMSDLEPGFGSSSSAAGDSRLEIVLNALSSFRDTVRRAARNPESIATSSSASKAAEGDASKPMLDSLKREILRLCDQLRDGDELMSAGVRLEDDLKGGPSVWKLDDPEKMRKQKQLEIAQKLSNEYTTLLRQLSDLQSKVQKFENAAISPAKHLAAATVSVENKGAKKMEIKPKYTQFDADGKPTHDVNGNPLTKGQLKDVEKEWKKLQEAHSKYSPEDLHKANEALAAKEAAIAAFKQANPSIVDEF